MTFEASITIGTGGITARLMPEENRVEIEIHNDLAPDEVSAALPKVLQHLADRSSLPIRRDGMTFYPRPISQQDHGEIWGNHADL